MEYVSVERLGSRGLYTAYLNNEKSNRVNGKSPKNAVYNLIYRYQKRLGLEIHLSERLFRISK